MEQSPVEVTPTTTSPPTSSTTTTSSTSPPTTTTSSTSPSSTSTSPSSTSPPPTTMKTKEHVFQQLEQMNEALVQHEKRKEDLKQEMLQLSKTISDCRVERDALKEEYDEFRWKAFKVVFPHNMTTKQLKKAKYNVGELEYIIRILYGKPERLTHQRNHVYGEFVFVSLF